MRASYRINKPPEVSGIALQDNSFYSPLFNDLSNLLDPMAESHLMRNQEMLVSKLDDLSRQTTSNHSHSLSSLSSAYEPVSAASIPHRAVSQAADPQKADCGTARSSGESLQSLQEEPEDPFLHLGPAVGRAILTITPTSNSRSRPFSVETTVSRVQKHSLCSSASVSANGSISRSVGETPVSSMLNPEMLNLGLSKQSDRRTVTCNCKKSRCLKMYCDCFRLTEYCKSSCNCVECANSAQCEAQRQTAIKAITERNPEAFKYDQPSSSLCSVLLIMFTLCLVFDVWVRPRVVEDVTSNSKGHLTGCHCRKSACLKKYCECFTAKVPCAERCRCTDCKNLPALYGASAVSNKNNVTTSNSSSQDGFSQHSQPTPTSSSVHSAQTLRKAISLPTNGHLNDEYSEKFSLSSPQKNGSLLRPSEVTIAVLSPAKRPASNSPVQTPLSNHIDPSKLPKKKAIAYALNQQNNASLEKDLCAPSSPIASTAITGDSALMSPIKLLELASVCEESRQELEGKHSDS
eukprot:scaffold2798_cov160-Ochromonas_danica.AAC.29